MENQLANFAAREEFRGVSSMKWHDVQQYVVEIVLLEYGNHIYYLLVMSK